MMRFRLLGPLEVRAGEDWQGIGAPKWRSVLAALLINAGQIVPADFLISEVWGDAPPETAGNLISIYVLRLRRLLGATDGGLLVTRAPGYQLKLAPTDTDAQLFETMVRNGRRTFSTGDAEGAARALAEALDLWRGKPLADVPATALVEAEADRLAELRLDAIELRITAELAFGGYVQAVPELRRILAGNPLREALWLLLMTALDGAGRHAEALDVYGQARSAIAEELGVEPGPELRKFHGQLLAKDSTIIPGSISGGTIAARPRPQQPTPPAGQEEAPPGPGGGATATAPPGSPHPAGRRSPVPTPAQLPADIADYTGRAEQVGRLCEMLAGTAANVDPGAVRIAVVAGSGGLGKTSLAVHAAHRVRRKFPDGQLYVDLLGATAHPQSPADVLARFLRDLGMDGRDVPLDEDERAARYRTTLATRRMLVVLDNARDAAQVRPLLPGAASCAVLVTTRSRMPDLASTKLVDLNVLDEHEALAMFTKVVGEERATAEPEATAELLQACAGLPLAIRICASRLATRSGWTIRTLAGRLRDERRRLDEMRVGDLAVRASFQVSFTSLPARTDSGGIDPARAFRLLGVWQGPSISSAAAAALFGVSDYLAEDALETLVDAYLLESVGSDRYKFHDLLRVYSSERATADLPAADRDAATERLLDWYVRTADAAAQAVSPHRYRVPPDVTEEVPQPLHFVGAQDALEWYDQERVNVVAATRQAAAHGLHEVAWRLPASLFSMFNRRGNWADLVETHRIALASAHQAGDLRGEAWVRNNLGEALGRRGLADGVGHLQQSLDIRTRLGDRNGEAQAAHNLAEVQYLVNGAEAALPYMHQSLDVQRAAGQPAVLGATLNNLGEIYLELGRLEESVGCLQEALPIFEGIKSSHGEGHVLLNLGRVYLDMGRRSEALDGLERALTIHEASGDRPNQALALKFLGHAQRGAGRPDEARESLSAALAIFADLGDAAAAETVRSEFESLPDVGG
ncbi:MAG: AfsR/SARP family transcriptional regulator [Streptosporangiaceae bacterium]